MPHVEIRLRLGAQERHSGAGRGWRRPVLRNVLVVAQVAFSLVVASFDLKLNGYDEARGRQFTADLSDRVATLPGVEAVSFANIVAFSDLFWISGATIEGYQPQPNERLAFDFNAISPGYFHTIGTPLVEGREFSSHDSTDASRVVIVNEAAARRYWPGQEAVGKRTSRGQVVGVVRNSKEKGLAASPRPAMFLPLLQSYAPELTLHVRTATETQALVISVRREVQALDPTLPLYNVSTLAGTKGRLVVRTADGGGVVDALCAARTPGERGWLGRPSPFPSIPISIS